MKITNNEIYKMLILDTITNIAHGEKISLAFKDHWAFPMPAYEMLVTGEKTGQLPDMMGKVLRYPDIIVSYTDIGTMQTVRDTVSGFTAVIFQHETDHLDGILYTDKAEEVIPL